MAYFWLSFVNKSAPESGPDRFLGVAVIQAPGTLSAVKRAWTLGINPGGEVSISEVSALPPIVEAAAAGKLLTRDEAIALNQALQACS